MKICMVGEGAFGKKHLAALKNIEEVEVVSLVGGVADATEAIASEFGVPHWATDLEEGLAQEGVEAAILTTPTPIHASQAIEVMQAGKHVEVIGLSRDGFRNHAARQMCRCDAMAGIGLRVVNIRCQTSDLWIQIGADANTAAPLIFYSDLCQFRKNLCHAFLQKGFGVRAISTAPVTQATPQHPTIC